MFLASNDLSQAAEARRYLERAFALDPENARAHTLNGFDLLANERYERGWPEYEWRLRKEGWEGGRFPSLPRWELNADARSVVVVNWEQGLGDQIMFASCLGDLIARCGYCIVACDARLVGLFRRSFPAAHVTRAQPAETPCACPDEVKPTHQIPLGSLPLYFRSKKGDFPPPTSYLVADAMRVAAWKAQLRTLGGGIKIGLSWRGGSAGTHRSLRSFELPTMLSVVRGCDAVLISLQYGDVEAEIATQNERSESRVHHWSPVLRDYDDTAALVCALDLVITACTSLVHLCGALDAPCWVLVPAAAEWRYLRRGNRMPWYGSVTMYRQTVLGDWSEPIAAVRTALAERYPASFPRLS